MRRLALALLLAAACATAAGCGVRSTLDPVATAATKTQKAGAARLTFRMRLAGAAFGARPLELTGSGVLDGDRGEVTMDLSDLLRRSGAPAGDGIVREIFLRENGHSVVYLRTGLLEQLSGGKHWVRLDLSQAGEELGVDLGKLMQNGTSQDPTQLLAMLRATGGKVIAVGAERVGGAATTHYRASVDFLEAARQKGVSDDALVRLGQLGVPTSVPVDVWVGDDGLVRRFRMAYTMTPNAVPLRLAMQMDLRDWGSAANVVAPPADDVFEAP